MPVVKLWNFLPQCVVGTKSWCGFKSIPSSSLFKEERLRVINIPSPPFQEVPELQMIANWESALSNFYSLPEASALADVREEFLETTETGPRAALNQGINSCTDHQHLHSGLSIAHFSQHCWAFKTSRIWPREQTKQWYQTFGCFFLFLS